MSKCENGKSSLVFVFDTTGSMYNDLEQLREGAEQILSTALEENVIGDFVFVPFRDPAVGPSIVTSDKDKFKSALEKVRVYGGGDCPEKSLGGIQMALDVSAEKSYVYVFTDATAGDHMLVGEVLDAVQRKQSQVVFVLTGHCNDLDKPSFKVYQQIAAASSGQVFNLNKTSVHKVLDFVKSSIKGRMVNLGSSVNTAGSNYTQDIPVDSTLGEMTVSVSGASPQITVLDPSGAQLTGPPKLITTLDLAEIMVVKVMQPEPGNWTITVASEEEYSVKVAGRSNLTFQHGFSVQKPGDLAVTSYRPLKGTYNHMMVALTQNEPFINVTIDYAEILTLNGSTLFELPLTVEEPGSQVYMAEAFIPPDEEFFYIAINGRDEYNQPLRRVGITAVRAKIPDVPFLTTSQMITAHAHSRVVLKCKVESLVPVTAVWKKGSRKLMPQLSSLQTTTIEYVIEDFQEENVGSYKCVAQNAAGENKATTKVYIIVDPPQVSIEPANVTVKIGDEVTLTCTVFSEALLVTFKFITNTTDEKVTNIVAEPNMNGINKYVHIIQNASEHDAGSYTCVAANKGGSTNQSTTLSIQPNPTAKILNKSPLTVNLHSLVQLTCLVDNSESLRWVHNGIVKEGVINGSVTDVLEVNVTENGDWKCEAANGDLEASDTIQISLIIEPPVVSIRGERNITVLNGTLLTLECEIVSIPPPIVVWQINTGNNAREVIAYKNQSSLTLAEPPYKYVSTLTLNSSIANVNGQIYCQGENSQGIAKDMVQVNVIRKMSVIEGFNDTSAELYNNVKLHCRIDSHPPPRIAWHHNGTIINTDNIIISDDNFTVEIKELSFDDLGTYSCEASNGFEKVELEGTLSVHGLENPVLMKEQLKIIADTRKSTLIPCRVLKGNPSPRISWQYKSPTTDVFTKLPDVTDLQLDNPTVDKQGIYRCVAENVIGADVYDVEIKVHYPPKLKSSDIPNNTLEVKVGETVTFSCEATGNPPPILLWTKDGQPLKFSNNILLAEDSLIMKEVTEYDSGSYICNATSSLGSDQKYFTLVVYVAPNISSKPPSKDPLEVVEGQLVELPCEANGIPKPIVSWTQNGLKFTDDKIYVDEFGIRFVANLTNFGNYTCLVHNMYGNTSVTYTVFVWVPPSIKPPLETSIGVLTGGNVNFQCDVIGFPIPSVQWVFRYELLKENTSEIRFNDVGNLNITSASSKHEGPYVCVAENLAGKANKLINLNVHEPPNILDDDYGGPYLATNLDSAIVIACRATGKPKPYVMWSKDDVYLHKDSQYKVGNDGTLTIKSPTEDMSGNYTCMAKNKVGSVNKTIPVQVYSLPTRTQTDESQSKATVLEHTSAAVGCPVHASVGDTVKWYKDAELISTGRLQLSNVSRSSRATYACVVTNAVGSAYSTVNVDVQWPPKFIENDDEIAINDDDNIYTKHDDKDTKYINQTDRIGTVLGSDNNDHSHENDEPKTNNSKKGKAKAFVKVAKNKNFENDKNKPVNHAEFGKSITQNDEEHVTKKKGNDRNKDTKIMEIVNGDDAYLDCETDAKPVAKIKWLQNSKPIVFQDKPTLKLLNVKQRDAGTYKCVASNLHGTVHKLFQVEVSVPPFISEFDMLDVTLMNGVNATLECNAKGYPEPMIHWTFSNLHWHLTNSSLSATGVSAHSEGVFRCEARNKAGVTHIVYRVSVFSGAKVGDIIAFAGGEGVNIDKRFEAASGSHIRIACKASGNPGPAIQWIRNGRLLGENPQGIDYADLVLDVGKSDAGGYSCVAVNEGGTDERTVFIDVVEPPQIFQSIVQKEPAMLVLSGQAFYLHCHPFGTPMPEVYWFKDGLPLKLFDESMVSMEFGEVIFVKSAVEDQAGNYTCVARNKVGNTSVTYLVDVLVPPPQPKESSTPVSIRHGKPLVLSCPVEGLPTPTVMWIKHPYTEIGAATPTITLLDDNVTLMINRTQVSDSGNYSCILANKAGTTEVGFSVTVTKPPSIAGDGDEKHLVALSRSVVLKCEADGHPLPRISWLKDTQKLSDISSNVHKVLGNSLLALWRVTSRDAGQYICVVENEAGTAHRRYNILVQVPGKWDTWSQWSLCNVTCGVGQQSRARSCHYIDEDNNVINKSSQPDRVVLDEKTCKGPAIEKRICQMPPCEEEGSGVWLAWAKWSPCSSTCGKGTQARTRKCKDKLCEGDNVQIRKCPDLPKCSSNEDNSENDVYSKEDSKESYMPDAVFEKRPEIMNPLNSGDTEQIFYTAAGAPPSRVSYDVPVDSNIDGSDMGGCSPGYKPDQTNGTCQDIDECEVDSNQCHSTQICENTEGAYRCTCAPGYVALGAGQRCMDINECSQDTSGCEYACVNTAGGYVCACPAHMRLHHDKHHCYTASSYRKPYEELDTVEYLSASVEHPARYKHIRTV